MKVKIFAVIGLAVCLSLGCRKVPQQWTAEAPCTPQLQAELMITCQPGQMIQPDHSWVYYWMLLNTGGPGRTHVQYHVYQPLPQPTYRPPPAAPQNLQINPSPRQTGGWWSSSPRPTTSSNPSPRTSGGFQTVRPASPAPSSPRTSGGFRATPPARTSPRTSGGFHR